MNLLALPSQIRDVIVAGFFVGAALAALYGTVKVTFQKVVGKPLPANRVTLFLDGLVEGTPNFLGVINKWLQAVGQQPILAPGAAPTPTPSTPSSAAPSSAAPSRPGVTLLALVLLVSACTPRPPDPTPDDATVVTPRSWVDTARLAVDITAWALPLTRAVVSAWSQETPATTARILGAIDSAQTVALPGFRDALDVYESTRSAGARCEARAAGRGLIVALVAIADTLADAGWGFASSLGNAVASIGGVVDALTPACVPLGQDAGFSAPGQDALDHLRELARRPLRPFPALRGDGGA